AGPAAVVGVVVPLPLGVQCRGREGVDAGQRLRLAPRQIRQGVRPSPRAAHGLELRPAVGGPGDRGQGRDAAAGVGVGEGHVVPVAVGGVHQAALVGHAAALGRARQVQQQLPHLVRAPGAGGRLEDVLAVGGAGQEDVVVPADPVEAGALEHAGRVRGLEDRLVAHLSGGVGRELGDTDLGVAVGHVDGVVVIEQQAGVEVGAADLRVSAPWAFGGGGGVDVGAGEVDLAYPVEPPVARAVVQRGGPDAADVAAPALEVVFGPEVEFGHRVAGELPVDQVP